MVTPTTFDWRRVRWDRHDKPAEHHCSYCGDAIGDDDVPLRLWNRRGDGCVFCHRCEGAAFSALMLLKATTPTEH